MSENSQITNGGPTNTALAQIPQDVIAQLGNPAQVRMSFNPGTPDGAVKLVLATLSEVKDLSEMANKPLELTDYISHPASSAGDQPGEIQEFIRTVVFDKDGTAYSCGSLGVQKSIAVLEMTAGRAPWNPPVKVTVKVTKTANKNNWMILEPDVKALMARLSKPAK